jgi:hypothetical protein
MSRADLAQFIDQLADSLEEEPEVWENDTLARFLRALSIWTTEMDGYFIGAGQAPPDSPTWQLIAHMLLAARIYE